MRVKCFLDLDANFLQLSDVYEVLGIAKKEREKKNHSRLGNYKIPHNETPEVFRWGANRK